MILILYIILIILIVIFISFKCIDLKDINYTLGGKKKKKKKKPKKKKSKKGKKGKSNSGSSSFAPSGSSSSGNLAKSLDTLRREYVDAYEIISQSSLPFDNDHGIKRTYREIHEKETNLRYTLMSKKNILEEKTSTENDPQNQNELDSMIAHIEETLKEMYKTAIIDIQKFKNELEQKHKIASKDVYPDSYNSSQSNQITTIDVDVDDV